MCNIGWTFVVVVVVRHKYTHNQKNTNQETSRILGRLSIRLINKYKVCTIWFCQFFLNPVFFLLCAFHREAATSAKSVDDTLPQYKLDKAFADRRYKVSSARTYFYLNESTCERNMEIFIKCLEAVSGKFKKWDTQNCCRIGCVSFHYRSSSNTFSSILYNWSCSCQMHALGFIKIHKDRKDLPSFDQHFSVLC